MPATTDEVPDDFEKVVHAVLALVTRAGRLDAVTADAERWPQLEASATRLRERRFLIAVCGEFSGGKSTLLGALLRRPELFPDDVGATTSVPTVVTWGAAEQILVVTEQAPVGVPIAAADLPRYVTQAGNPDNRRKVLEVRIALPNPLLQDGIGFVDLPGLGSTRAAHAVVTNAYLERIDAALFVNAQTLSETELTFLQRVSERVGDALVIARSKADLVEDQYGSDGVDRAVADARTKAAQMLGVRPEALVIVPVAAKNYMPAFGDPDEEAATNVPTLAASIDTAITARSGSLLATTTLASLDAVAAAAHEHATLRLTALTEGRTPEIEQIQAQLAARRDELARAQKDEPEWTHRVDAALDRIGTDESHALSGALRGVRRAALDRLDHAADDLDANRFTSQILNQVHDLYSSAHRTLERKVNAVLEEVAGDIGLGLDAVHADSAFRGTSAGGFVEPEVVRKERTQIQRYSEASGNAVRKAGGWRLLGTIAGIAAGVLFAPVTGGLSLLGGAALGAAAGTVAGTVHGLSDELDALDRVNPEVRRRKLRQHLTDAFEPNQTEAADRLKKAIKELQREAAGTLTRAVAAARTDVEGRISRLDADLRRTTAEATREAALLRPVVAELDRIRREAATLSGRLRGLSGRLPRWTAAAASEPVRHDDHDWADEA